MVDPINRLVSISNLHDESLGHAPDAKLKCRAFPSSLKSQEAARDAVSASSRIFMGRRGDELPLKNDYDDDEVCCTSRRLSVEHE